MAKQSINLGTQPSGVGGDTARSANVKINANFDELYLVANGLGSASKLDIMLTPDQTWAGVPYRVLKQGDYGLGRPLSGRVLPTGGSNRADVLQRNTGFSLDVITDGDKPAGVQDGPMLTFGFDNTQGFQIQMDWRDGTMHTFPSASAAPEKKWIKQYHVNNVVGTIAGGAIIERGSNASGDFTKFSDGTLICFGVKDMGSVSIGVANGPVYNSGIQSIGALGASFVPGSFSLSLSAVTTDSTTWIGTPSAGSGNFYFFATTPAIRACKVVYIAIGRWK